MTGANGYVGRAVVERLAAEGRSVRAALRRPDCAMPRGASQVTMADLGDPQAWPALLTDIDCIVHCAARAHVLKEDSTNPLALFRHVNTQATLDLARAAAGAGVRRFVFISSIGVNGGRTKGRAFRHDDAPNPHSDYAIAKQEAEEGLPIISQETGLEVVVVRPPLVLGPDAKGNLGLLAKFVRKGLPLPLGSVTHNRRDLVSLDTLASLVSTCVDHPAAASETFLVSDGAPLSTRQIVERIGIFVGRKPCFLSMPEAVLGLALKIIGRGGLASQLLGDLEVDIGHTRTALGWAPPTAHLGKDRM